MNLKFLLPLLSIPCIFFAVLKMNSMKARNMPINYQLGNFKVISLLDGHVDLHLNNIIKGKNSTDHPCFHPTSPEQIITIPINVFLIDMGTRKVLVDVGLAGMYNSQSGNLIPALHQAGYAPEQITDICITHLHPDHCAGLLTPQKTKAFKYARLHISKIDLEYWVHEQKLYPELSPLILELIESYELHAFESNEKLFDGVTVIAQPGHSPGHSGFLFESEGEKLLIWGDIIHIHKLQFADPEISLKDDSDNEQAIETRKFILEKAVNGNLLIGGAHLNVPGLGFVEKNKDSKYVFLPE